jgi:hypothetical protein
LRSLQGAGEGALLVAEQRAFDQLARNRRDVDGDQRRLGVGGFAVQQARQQLLAGAALAEDQHRRRQLRDLVHRFEHVLQGGARPGDELARRGVAGRILERQHVALQVLALARVADQVAQRVGIGVLGQEVVGAKFDGPDRAVDVGRRRRHDDLDEREVFADDLQQVDAAKAGLPDVGDEDVDVFLVHQRQAGLGRRRPNHAVIAAQGLRQALPCLVAGVNHQHGLARGSHRPKFRVYGENFKGKFRGEQLQLRVHGPLVGRHLGAPGCNRGLGPRAAHGAPARGGHAHVLAVAIRLRRTQGQGRPASAPDRRAPADVRPLVVDQENVTE